MSSQTFFDNFALLADAPNGVAKLRELVLQLAVEGKLVSQDPHDEPAIKLFERVNKEKKRLINEGKLNNKRPLSEINDGEKFFELPEHWIWVRLGDVVDQRLGKMLDKGKNKGKPYPYLRNTNVQWLRFDLSDVKEMRFEDSELEEYEVRLGDLLVCEGGEPGRCAIWDGQLKQVMFQKAIHRVRPFAGIDSWFLLYRLLADAKTGRLDKHFTGATIKHFTGQELSKYVIGLPPLKEQKRIVAKVNELMRLCDELEARQQARRESRVRLNNATLAPLNTAASLRPEEFEQASARLADNFAALYDSPETVGKLRSTILRLAVQGKLVPQDSNEESAKYLIGETLAMRKQLWMEKLITKRERGGKTQNLKSIAVKYSEPIPLTIENPYPLPKGWIWCSLEQISEHIVDGTHHTPTYVVNGIPFISAKDIVNGEIDFSGCRNISEDEYKQLIQRCNPKMGDVLVTKSGSIGKVAVIKTHDRFTLFESVALIPIIGEISRTYIATAIYLSASGDFGAENQKGMAVRHLHLKDLRQMPLALPPLEEQKRIVVAINQLMALCDELETKLRQTEADSEKLMKAAVRDLLASVNESLPEESLSVIA